MKITRIRIFKTDLPYVDGMSAWPVDIAIQVTRGGKLYAPDAAGLGVRADFASLGDPIAEYVL